MVTGILWHPEHMLQADCTKNVLQLCIRSCMACKCKKRQLLHLQEGLSPCTRIIDDGCVCSGVAHPIIVLVRQVDNVTCHM